jgi:hypothetical protein
MINKTDGVEWSYFNQFEGLTDKYMPRTGEGDTMASQIVTAVNKLVYKWYNDGDVFDNTHNLEGWANDLSSYANWLYNKVDGADEILNGIEYTKDEYDYEELLKKLADYLMDEELLDSNYALRPKVGTIYNCEGPFEHREWTDEEEEY